MLISMLFLGASAQATTLSVGSGGAYSSIQDAVVAAASGDRIEVGPGTYTENVDLAGKDLDLVEPGMILSITPKYAKGKVPSWLEELPAGADAPVSPLPPRHADDELAKKGEVPTDPGAKLDEGSTGVERFD